MKFKGKDLEKLTEDVREYLLRTSDSKVKVLVSGIGKTFLEKGVVRIYLTRELKDNEQDLLKVPGYDELKYDYVVTGSFKAH